MMDDYKKLCGLPNPLVLALVKDIAEIENDGEENLTEDEFFMLYEKVEQFVESENVARFERELLDYVNNN